VQLFYICLKGLTGYRSELPIPGYIRADRALGVLACCSGWFWY